eukprot:g3140.t1
MRLLILIAIGVFATVVAAPSTLVFGEKDNTRCTVRKRGDRLNSGCDVEFGGSSIGANAASIQKLEDVAKVQAALLDDLTARVAATEQAILDLQATDAAHARDHAKVCRTGAWGVWGACTCGPAGVQTRSRQLSTARERCVGVVPALAQTRACGTSMPCPIHGGWSEWGSWTPCSRTCGAGKKARRRTCDAPTARHGGNECTGGATEEAACNGALCPRCPAPYRIVKQGSQVFCVNNAGGGGNFAEATKFCKDNGMKLVEPDTAEVSDALDAVCTFLSHDVGHGGCTWIGARCSVGGPRDERDDKCYGIGRYTHTYAENWRFLSSGKSFASGTPNGFMPTLRHQCGWPSRGSTCTGLQHGAYTGTCAAWWRPGGEWRGRRCDLSTGVICQMGTRAPPKPTCGDDGGEVRTFRGTEMCYGAGKKTYGEAKTWCAQRGMALIEPKTPALVAAAGSVCDHNSCTWLGMRCSAQRCDPKQWRWNSGETVEFNNFKRSGDGHCASISTDFGKWQAGACHGQYAGALCLMKHDPHWQESQPNCKGGSILKHEGHVFCRAPGKDMQFGDAKRWCARHGLELVEPKTASVARAVDAVCQQHESCTWLDAYCPYTGQRMPKTGWQKCSADMSAWQWWSPDPKSGKPERIADGARHGLSFSSSYLQHSGQHSACLLWLKPPRTWAPAKCTGGERAGALCLMGAPVHAACRDGWQRAPSGKCTKLFPVSGTFTGSHRAAMTKCQEHGSTLASVPSDDDEAFLRGLMRRPADQREGAWIGAAMTINPVPRHSSKGWFWMDGTSFRHEHWQAGQPNDIGGECTAQGCCAAKLVPHPDWRIRSDKVNAGANAQPGWADVGCDHADKSDALCQYDSDTKPWPASTQWRLTNGKDLYDQWDVCGLEFFSDAACSQPLAGEWQASNGEAKIAATPSCCEHPLQESWASAQCSYWKSQPHVFAARSNFIGQAFPAATSVKCVKFRQYFYPQHRSESIVLQANVGGSASRWVDVMSRSNLLPGRPGNTWAGGSDSLKEYLPGSAPHARLVGPHAQEGCFVTPPVEIGTHSALAHLEHGDHAPVASLTLALAENCKGLTKIDLDRYTIITDAAIIALARKAEDRAERARKR